MTEKFAFNACQYFDFRQESDDINDSYFDNNSENDENLESTLCPKLLHDTIEDEIENNSEADESFYSPNAESENSPALIRSKLRKSLSMSNLILDNERQRTELKQKVDTHGKDAHIKPGCSQESINRLSQPKCIKSNSSTTLAQAVLNFQLRTPKRFRSKVSPQRNKDLQTYRCNTKPHAPNLKTATRTRPADLVTKEELESKELEELKKFKIKAHPVNKHVLRGPFKAQPIPNLLKNDIKTSLSSNAERSTNRTVQTSTLDKKNKRKTSLTPLKPTTPMPFSFERRDQQMMKKKEDLINKVLEEEKKAREFHARPVPKCVLRSRNSSRENINEINSSKSSINSNEDLQYNFKAKPATVLHKKPFVPKKPEHIVTIDSFNFATDQRLEARHKFDEKLKEREALAEAQKREREEYLKKLEQEEIARIRKEMEHKAQPIKKYKEVKIEPSKKVTEAISPKFHTDRIRNKENIN